MYKEKMSTKEREKMEEAILVQKILMKRKKFKLDLKRKRQEYVLFKE